ncbi:hypothetical protein RRG08_031578 [Elysia crispata]|uniref:Uncharacterized protein n=1 Tax=Elysia crispata TaxID=231223 RepID=A0AAE1B3M4_9GAST|nr:hypothetical protein RRG08_031578 [Elysia crispata]
MGCKFECRTEARVCVCVRGEKKWEDVRRGPKGLEKEKEARIRLRIVKNLRLGKSGVAHQPSSDVVILMYYNLLWSRHFHFAASPFVLHDLWTFNAIDRGQTTLTTSGNPGRMPIANLWPRSSKPLYGCLGECNSKARNVNKLIIKSCYTPIELSSHLSFYIKRLRSPEVEEVVAEKVVVTTPVLSIDSRSVSPALQCVQRRGQSIPS